MQARRTRELLDRYYDGPGSGDPIRITIPTGQYAAAFVPHRPPTPSPRSDEEAARRTTIGPRLAVVELRHRATGVDRRIAAGLTESLVHTLSRFPGLETVGPLRVGASTAGDDLATVATRTGADFVLHGMVVASPDTVRVTVHLSAGTGEVRWSDSFEHPLDEFVGFGAEDEIVARVAATVGDFGSIVLREPLPSRADCEPCVADALRQYYAYLDELTPEVAGTVIRDLEAAVELEPENSHVLSSLAFTHAVDVLMQGAVAEDSMASAESLARRALRREPTNAVANNVLAIVALARGLLSQARKHADLALELAPYHPGNSYVAGMVVGASGDWELGIAIIRRVVRTNPYGPNHRRTLLAVAALMEDDVAGALAEASLLHFPGYVYGPLLKAICLGEMDLLDGAGSSSERLARWCRTSRPIRPLSWARCRPSPRPPLPTSSADSRCWPVDSARPELGQGLRSPRLPRRGNGYSSPDRPSSRTLPQ